MEKFKNLKLSEGLLKAIQDAKFSEPSEIQEKTIPLVLQGKDVLGSAATGSGKTLAFGAGIIEKVQKGNGLQALILTPTRELAEQVATNIKKFSKFKGLKVHEIYGGVSINPQIDDLEHSDIVVGTPGRILDHLERRTINLSKINFLVLDEADRMLDMGFIDDVDRIIKSCPTERQTLLFSATISSDIEHLSKKYMKHPVLVSVESYVDPSKLTQVYYDVPSHLKFSLLVHMLKQESGGLVMVFCNTRQNADMVANNLKRYGFNSLAIHGGLSQNRRNFIIQHFHSQETFILVCTDVAARGLDIKNVSHVYNYDIPKNSTEYIHRIGRTARAGKEGKAISLLASRDYENFSMVTRDDSLNILPQEVPELEPLNVNFNQRRDFNRGGRSHPREFRGRSNSGSGRGRSREGEYSGGRDSHSRRPSRPQHSRSSGHSGYAGPRSSGGSRSFSRNSRRY